MFTITDISPLCIGTGTGGTGIGGTGTGIGTGTGSGGPVGIPPLLSELVRMS